MAVLDQNTGHPRGHQNLVDRAEKGTEVMWQARPCLGLPSEYPWILLASSHAPEPRKPSHGRHTLGTRRHPASPLHQEMNAFLYILKGKVAVGDGSGEEKQIEAHNTVTLTKVPRSPPRGFIEAEVASRTE